MDKEDGQNVERVGPPKVRVVRRLGFRIDPETMARMNEYQQKLRDRVLNRLRVEEAAWKDYCRQTY